jgi:twitching motility protein PilT
VPQMYSAIQTGQAVGMQTLDQCLTTLIKENKITTAEARSKAANKDAFAG